MLNFVPKLTQTNHKGVSGTAFLNYLMWGAEQATGSPIGPQEVLAKLTFGFPSPAQKKLYFFFPFGGTKMETKAPKKFRDFKF